MSLQEHLSSGILTTSKCQMSVQTRKSECFISVDTFAIVTMRYKAGKGGAVPLAQWESLCLICRCNPGHIKLRGPGFW